MRAADARPGTQALLRATPPGNARLTNADGRLHVHYTVHNGDKAPILLFNRLHSGGHPREVDKEEVYRFVEGDVLRLLLGPAPLPSVPVTFKNLPEATRIEPYSSFDADLSMPLPVTEYSVYFDDVQPDGPVQRIHTVEVFASYVDATGAKTIASTTFPDAFTVSNPSDLHTVSSGPIAFTLVAVLQTGEFSRFKPK